MHLTQIKAPDQFRLDSCLRDDRMFSQILHNKMRILVYSVRSTRFRF
jgi:hypothetical protein